MRRPREKTPRFVWITGLVILALVLLFCFLWFVSVVRDIGDRIFTDGGHRAPIARLG